MDHSRLDWPLPQLAAALDQHLAELGYSDSRRERYRCLAKQFNAFAQNHASTDRFSEELVTQYLRHLGVEDPVAQLSQSNRQRLTWLRMLAAFRLHGCLQRRRHIAITPIAPAYQPALDAYLADLTRREYRPGTIRIRGYIRKFLHFIESAGVRIWTDLTARHLADYVASQVHICSSTMSVTLANVRSFLRFLYLHGYHPADLSGAVPRLRAIPKHLPAIWTRENVEKLLGAVDRGNPVGKRNYAMLLLAVQLGLRVSDIHALRLEHLHWDTRRIVFTQAKTGREQSLPILPELGEALIAYLQHGRPVTSAREVFITLLPPFTAFSSTNKLNGIIERCCRRAGITLPADKHHGFHSLRHTLASRLLEQQTPLTTISEILGHLNIHSTRVYLTIDAAALRQCALDPEEVTHASNAATL